MAMAEACRRWAAAGVAHAVAVRVPVAEAITERMKDDSFAFIFHPSSLIFGGN
jgi:hypothetical protein